MKFIISLPPPINSTYKTTKSGGFYKSEKAKDWEKEALYEIIKQRRKYRMITSPVYVSLEFYFKRERDIDSGIKICLDLLQNKVIKNDSQIIELHVAKCNDKINPRLEIEVEEMEL